MNRYCFLLSVFAGAVSPSLLVSQDYVGPSKCTTCHASRATPAWKKYHEGTLRQVDQGKGPAWAQAVSGGNTKSPRCLKCHAPVVLATGPGPVSCETCHGPAKAYLIPHRQDAFYQGSDRKGMVDLYKKPGPIASLCVTCHVLGSDDKDIAAAGHPTGGNFDTGKKLQTIAHWPSDEAEGVSAGPNRRTYDPAFYGQVMAQAKPLLASRFRALGNLPAGLPPPGPPPGPKAPTEGVQTVAPSTEEFRELKPGEQIKLMPDAPTGAYAPPPPVREAPSAVAPEAPRAAVVPSAPAPPPRVLGAREQAADVLIRLLREKRRLDIPRPATRPTENDDLRSVEDDVFALALEVLRRP